MVVCESHSVAGGAAHCWTRKGCHFDSGTALFFGLPASRHSLHAAEAADRASNAAAAGGAAVAEDICEGSTTGINVPCSSDNPLSAVLTLLTEPLDLITYGPERTCLVFPGGVFKAQVRMVACRCDTQAPAGTACCFLGLRS